MEISKFGEKIELLWLDFSKHKEEILELRRKIFVENQGIKDGSISTEKDEDGFHLGAFYEGKLVSILSTYVYNYDDEIVKRWDLPIINEKLVFRFTKRAELPEFKGTRLAEFIAAYAWKAFVDVAKPQCLCLSLLEEHKKLSLYYTSFGFKFHKEINNEIEKVSVFVQDEKQIRNTYLLVRRLVDVLYAYLKIIPPSFVNYLILNDKHELLAVEKVKHENLYLNALSLKDELPRLLGQSRLLELAQEDFNNQFNLPFEEGNFLDIGCGPGVYLSRLSKHQKFSKYKFTGIDLAEEMISYAKLSYRNINWLKRDVYETGFDNESFEIVHASFLFIHLLTPEIALKEINRILKKKGTLYVIDVNDSTFEGPNIINRLIQKHSQYYEGDRNILNILPELASRNSLKLIEKKHITVNNQGNEEKPEKIGNLLKLGKVTMWAMFSFINQRQDIQKFYQKAEKYYFNKNCEISIQIQTQIFEKI